MYLHFSLFNHQCHPNCIKFFPNPQSPEDKAASQVRTTRAIKAGEELTISYIEPKEQSRARRLNILKNQFGFEPNDSIVRDELIEKLKDSTEKTPEILAQIEVFETRIDELHQKMKDCIESDNFMGDFPDDLLPKATALADEMSVLLDPRHVLLLRLNKILLEVLHPKLAEPQQFRKKGKRAGKTKQKTDFGDCLVLYLKTAYEIYKTQLLCLSKDHIDFATTYNDISMAIQSLVAWDSQKLFEAFPQWDNFQKATKFEYFCQTSVQKLDHMYK